MNYKRAMVFAVGTYVASFVIGIAMSFALSPDLAASQMLPISFIGLQLLVSLALGFGAAWFYFASTSTVASAMHGLYFGGVIVLGGFVLDFLLFIPGMLAGYLLSDLLSFYAQASFWAALALVLVGTTSSGFLHARMYGGTTGVQM